MFSITSRYWRTGAILLFAGMLAIVICAAWEVPVLIYLYLIPSPESNIAHACLKSRSTQIRCAAAHKLGRIGPVAKSAIPDLLVAMNDASPSVAGTAAWAVGNIDFISPRPESIVSLTKLTDHADGEVRRNATYALGLCGRNLFLSNRVLFENTLVPALVGKLDDSHVSRTAAQALASMGSIVVPTVKKLTMSTDSRIKTLATAAIVTLEGQGIR